MISAFVYDHDQKENQLLCSLSRDAVALLSDESLMLRDFAGQDDLKECLDDSLLPDAALVDVVGGSGLLAAGMIRKYSTNSEMMVIADSSISPMEYMTPSIRAASLLLRPYTLQSARNVIHCFYQALVAKRDAGEEENFVIENQDGKQLIPFSQIYYFEIREKRLYARLKNQEFSRYGTMEQLEKALPKGFLRCHRSYVVNTGMIRNIRLSEGLLYLKDDLAVPLSRKYKTAIKEFIHGQQA